MPNAAFLGQVRLRRPSLSLSLSLGQSTPGGTPMAPGVPATGAPGAPAAGQPVQLTQEQIQKLLQQQAAQGGGGGGGGGMAVMPQASQGNAQQYLIQHGALLEVMISAPPSVADAMRAAGQTPPAPQKVVLMVDTGASISGVRDSVASAVGLTPTGSVQVGGVAGTQNSSIYAAKIALPKYNINFDTVQIAGFQLPGQQDIDGLLGRDMLEKMNLVYSGIAGDFTLQAAAGASDNTWSVVGMGVLAVGAFASLFWLAKGAR